MLTLTFRAEFQGGTRDAHYTPHVAMRFATMTRMIDTPRLRARPASLFAGVALLLAGAGIYPWWPSRRPNDVSRWRFGSPRVHERQTRGRWSPGAVSGWRASASQPAWSQPSQRPDG